MSDIQVKAGGNLQAALDAAQPGDTVTLEAGATFQGQFKFPPKAGTVTLRSSGTLPNGRIGPQDAPQMATLVSGVAAMACDLYDATNWDLDGLRFLPNVGGAGEVIGLWRSSDIGLSRLLFEVPDTAQQKRFILGNGQRILWQLSHCAGVWKAGQDSQAFVAWDGAGPYHIADNYAEAAGENIMFGGADSSSDANRPKDILIVGNDIVKPLKWKGDGVVQVIKNLLEFKDGSRIQVRGNRFANNWGGEGQSGRSILITPRNQDGSAPWTRVEDVLIEQNTITNVDAGFSITGYDDLNQSQQTTRIVIRDNQLDCRGTAFLVMNDVGRLELYRNTVNIPGGGALLSLDKGNGPWAVRDLVLASNIAPNTYIHSPTALNDAALQAYCETYSKIEPGGPVPPPPPPDEIALLKAELAALKTSTGATDARLLQLLAYLGKTPTATRIAQVVSYLRGASK